MAEGELSARVSRRERKYRISDVGRAAVQKFLQPDYVFLVSDLGPNDRVTVTVTLTIAGGTASENGMVHAHLDLPRNMVEEVPL